MVQLYMPLQQMAKSANYQLQDTVGGFDARNSRGPLNGSQIGPNRGRILLTSCSWAY